jgi:selenocysteine-specific elongation factor
MNYVLGTAGHIDHGKTALVRALTGIDTDRLPAEKQRGITIDLGFASLDLGECHVALVDVPGHERFIRNMLAGASGLDLAMLVVAADDSVMPQTREHMQILTLLGLSAGVVALSKCDLVDPSWLDLVEEDIRSLVRGTFLEGAPIVRTPVCSAWRSTAPSRCRATARSSPAPSPPVASPSVTSSSCSPWAKQFACVACIGTTARCNKSPAAPARLSILSASTTPRSPAAMSSPPQATWMQHACSQSI